MASSISFTHEGATTVINVENIAWAYFDKDGAVHITFNGSPQTKFVNLSDRDKEALKRMLRITPS